MEVLGGSQHPSGSHSGGGPGPKTSAFGTGCTNMQQKGGVGMKLFQAFWGVEVVPHWHPFAASRPRVWRHQHTTSHHYATQAPPYVLRAQSQGYATSAPLVLFRNFFGWLGTNICHKPV